MALPVNLSTVTVTSTYLQLDGTPCAGEVHFTTKQALADGTGNAILPKGGITATLDEDGAISVVLPATDDSDLDATGWTYVVTEQMSTPKGTRSYEIALPASPSTVNLADLAPVASVDAVSAFVRKTGDSMTGTLQLTPAGSGLNIAEGSNARMGVATLVAGTVTVATTQVAANARIFLSVQSLGTVTAPKAIAVTARVNGTSFTITSEDVTDTSVVAWQILKPAA